MALDWVRYLGEIEMDKVILVTGATSGFGWATVHKFANNGWKVIATGRRQERLDELKSALPDGSVHTAQMDLTDRQSIADAVAGIPEAFRPVTCLFNNGGLALGSKPIPDVREADWQMMVDTNIMGLIHMTLETLPLLKQAGRGASIINTGSVAGSYAYAGANVYGATKAFVHQFSANLRIDLADTDIRVTDLQPGMSKTEFSQVRSYGDASANEAFYKGVEPIVGEDIAETVWWLATRPAHLNINSIEIMPVQQNAAGFVIRRDE